MTVVPEKEKKKRVRSPNYPAINLEEALKRAHEFFDIENRHAANIEVASQHWGYKNYSSGGSLVIAALTSFGLMEDEGVGADRKVRLSPLGTRIVNDERPNSLEQMEGLKKAALLPKIHQELWGLWGNSLPSNENMRFYLLNDRGFNRGTVDQFIDQYRHTLSFAGLLEGGKISSAEPETEKIQVGDYIHWTSQGVDQFEEPRRVREISEDGKFVLLDGYLTGIPIGEATKCDAPAGGKGDEGGKSNIKPLVLRRIPPKPGMNSDVFTLDEGDVVLQWPSRMSPESYADFEAWLKLISRKARRAVQGEINPYPALSDYLSRQKADKVDLSFDQMTDEDVIGIELPMAAKEDQEWWSNDRQNQQSRAWLNVGWEVNDADPSKEIVSFIRT